MLRRIRDRMVERSIPYFTPDDDVSRAVAVEAAENGIRQAGRLVGWLVGTASVILVVDLAAMFFIFSPGQQPDLDPAVAARVSSQPGRAEVVGTDEAPLRRAAEDSGKKLDDGKGESPGKLEELPKEHETTLRLALEDTEKKLEEANKESQRKLEELTKERDRLQARVIDLEQQVATLGAKAQVQAKRDLSPHRRVGQPPKRVASHAAVPALTLPGQRAYQCADGRIFQDPTRCGEEHLPAVEDLTSPRATFQCGDGRTVGDPALCKPAQAPRPAG